MRWANPSQMQTRISSPGPSEPSCQMSAEVTVTGRAQAISTQMARQLPWKCCVEQLMEVWRGFLICLSKPWGRHLDCSWIMSLCLWGFTSHGNLQNIASSKREKKSLEFSVRPPQCALFYFILVLVFVRHAINILCRRAWLILHSGGYMSKAHSDSWVKYAGQWNLRDPGRRTCRMRRSLHPCFAFIPSVPIPDWLRVAPPATLGCQLCAMVLQNLTSASREDWMPLNHATLLWEVWCMQSDRQRSLQKLLGKLSVGKEWRMVALGTPPCP